MNDKYCMFCCHAENQNAKVDILSKKIKQIFDIKSETSSEKIQPLKL